MNDDCISPNIAQGSIDTDRYAAARFSSMMLHAYLVSDRTRVAHRTLLPLLLGLGMYLPALSHAQTSANAVLPIQADLVQSIDGTHVHKDDDVLAKLEKAWQGDVCTLPAASLIHGKVTGVTTSKGPSVSILFQYRCGEGALTSLTWIALLSPTATHPDDESKPIFQGPGVHSSGFRSAGNTVDNHVDMSGRQDPSLPVFPNSVHDSAARPPAAVRTGEVWKLPHISLSVGDTKDGGSIVRSALGVLKIPANAVLVLLPESVAEVNASVPPTVEFSRAPGKNTAPLPPVLGSCIPASCVRVRANTSLGLLPALNQVISLRNLGYRRLHSAEMQHLEQGTALAYLSDSTLLFTYEQKNLVTRSTKDRPEDRPRLVRGIVFNAISGQQVRQLEWRVPDRRQYLWPVRGGAVIHDGNSLRWLDANGETVRRLPLSEALLSFQSSPDAQHYLVGIVRELHNPQEHAALVQADASGPEEEVLLEVLNAALEVVDRGTASSRLMQPLLMKNDRVELRRHARSNQWFLRATTWSDGTVSDFARFTSTCTPRVEALANDALFVDGCDDSHNGHWYTVFNMAGKPAIAGELGWHDFEPLPTADDTSGAFAIAVPEGNAEVVRGSVFHGADLIHERVNVYDRAGKPLAGVEMRYPLPSLQPVGVAPGGRSLAIVDGDEIRVFKLP